MAATPTLGQRISALRGAVEDGLRQDLQGLERLLRDRENHLAVLLLLSRSTLRLLRVIYANAGHPLPSDNLFDCLVTAGRGDPARKVQGLKILPDEIITGLHTVRTLSNKADHAAETVTLSAADAENAAGLYLRSLEWWCGEAAPRRRQNAPPKHSPRPRPRWVLAVAASVGMLVVVVLWLGTKHLLAYGPEPPPITLPGWAEDLPAGPVLTLLAEGSPPKPAGLAVHPKLRLEVQGLRKGEAGFRILKGEDALASGRDWYRILAYPQTPGYLYVFQVDSGGAVAWLFPANLTCMFSSGANPVAADKLTRIPPLNRDTGLTLDDNVGVEHIVAVLSAERWPELEEALAAAGRVKPAGGGRVRENLDLVRGVEDDRGVGGEAPVVTEEADGKRVEITAPLERAEGWWLMVSRRFRHVAR